MLRKYTLFQFVSSHYTMVKILSAINGLVLIKFIALANNWKRGHSDFTLAFIFLWLACELYHIKMTFGI